MSHQVTLEIPDSIYRRAERYASTLERDVPEVLTDWLSMSAGEDSRLDSPAGIRLLPNDIVLRMSTMQPSEEQERRVSTLLMRQRERMITADERVELAELMEEYDAGLFLKSAALLEAVRRGLRPPLS
jgi:hypothetical protein